jgi:hypothetical protein
LPKQPFAVHTQDRVPKKIWADQVAAEGIGKRVRNAPVTGFAPQRAVTGVLVHASQARLWPRSANILPHGRTTVLIALLAALVDSDIRGITLHHQHEDRPGRQNVFTLRSPMLSTVKYRKKYVKWPRPFNTDSYNFLSIAHRSSQSYDGLKAQKVGATQ